CRIDEHLYSRATEEDRHVRVCVYDPRIDGPMRKQPPSTAKNALEAGKKRSSSSNHSSMTYLMLGLFAFLLMLFFFLLFLIL
ncbi:MAG: hypothetical protein ACRCUT_11560, partial [Spirochaetota bacterium]